jgi:NAD(P)H-hydrate epimerase
MIPTISTRDVAWLTRDQMVEVDRAMLDDYRIDLVRMMENAGRGLAFLARERFLDGDPYGRRVSVYAGTGGNGGGALVAARRLHNAGSEVEVVLTRQPDALAPVPKEQLDIIARMGLNVTTADDMGTTEPPDVILDGVIGYSLSGPPRGGAARLIRYANDQSVPILSLDVPSGIETTSGMVHEPAIRATATLTLALPKEGLRAAHVREYVGELFLADISVPPDLYRTYLGFDTGPTFAMGDVLHIEWADQS